MRQVKLNATDISVTATIVDDSGLPVTGLDNSTFPTVKYRKGRAAAVTVSLSALSAITDAHSDGGVIESGEGRYRLDLPDAVATSLDTVEIFGEATDKRLIVEKLQVVAFDPESATNLGLSNLDAAVSSRSSHTAANVRTEMDANSTQLAAIVADTNELQSDWMNGGRLDLILDDVLADTAAIPTFPTNFASLAITVGGAVTVGTLPSIPTGWITAAGIASEAITSAKFAENAITEGAIDTAALTTAKFDTEFLTANLIADDAITSAKIATDAKQAIATTLLDLSAGVETNLTPRQAFRLWTSALVGKSSNSGATFRDYNDSKARITATVDSSGNRTAVTTDAT